MLSDETVWNTRIQAAYDISNLNNFQCADNNFISIKLPSSSTVYWHKLAIVSRPDKGKYVFLKLTLDLTCYSVC
jgi:hypothetical protein